MASQMGSPNGSPKSPTKFTSLRPLWAIPFSTHAGMFCLCSWKSQVSITQPLPKGERFLYFRSLHYREFSQTFSESLSSDMTWAGSPYPNSNDKIRKRKTSLSIQLRSQCVGSYFKKNLQEFFKVRRATQCSPTKKKKTSPFDLFAILLPSKLYH